ncbi:hypothetical protein [Aminobacter sp. HY435]|uniref:hypothetical protein n=1 Tax=Aminobacter sp. HY435 TaxID=2970917 RepID=UPI0022B99674|nr:hypothetical protein [Aminobacter sp. HY435]
MKTFVLAAASLAFMSGAALASSSNGMIAMFNPSARVITLENGKSFTIPRDVALPPLQVGERVSIQLNDEGDKVTSVLR